MSYVQEQHCGFILYQEKWLWVLLLNAIINNVTWSLCSGGQVGRIPFDQQIHNFETTLDQVASKSGGAVAIADSVTRSLFFIGMGSNDYLNNYLMPNFPTRNQYNSQQFGDLLVQHYTDQLTVIQQKQKNDL